jgi:Tol biopolymer transport system component
MELPTGKQRARPVRMRKQVLAVALAAAVGVSLVGALAARSAFPGGNGLIVFVSNRAGDGYALYTMHTDGSGVHQLTSTAATTAHPNWSASGKQVAFERDSQIWTVDANGSQLHEIGPGAGGADWPRWSPDGTKIAFEWNDAVYVMNSDGTGITDIRPHANGDTGKWEPSWAPGGARIADVEGTGSDTGSISVSDADGSAANAVTNGAAQGEIDSAPDWSPNGARIAFERYSDCSAGTCTNTVQVMNANGSRLHEVQQNAATPVWSPNGTKILFVRKAGGASDIFVMNADGTSVKRLTVNHVSDFSPSWQPG